MRVDDGIESGAEVSPYYDPMLAKIITWGHDREEAIRKMVRALGDTAVLGVTTNIPYLLAILQEPHFRAGQTSTNYLAEHLADWRPDGAVSEEAWLGAAVFEFLRGSGKGSRRDTAMAGFASPPDPWNLPGSWRNAPLTS